MAISDNGRMNIGIGLDNGRLRVDAAESQNILRTISRTAEQEGSKMDAAFRKVGVAMAGIFTAQKALEFARSMIDVRKEIEGMEISFRTLLGSKQKADELFGQIRQFAVNTPMQLKDLASGAQTLLSFNVEADKVMTTLKALGDISMGDSQKFQSLTLAFAQMSSTGKLMGQDLLQMINAGFNPLATISEQTGKSIATLKDEMSKGAISAQMVENAFIAATSAGGKFHGMLEAQSHSIAGAISNLQGAVDDMLNDMGEASQGVITDACELLTDMAKNYRSVAEAVAVLIGLYGTYKAAVAATVVVTRALQMAEVQKNLAAKEGVAISTLQALRYALQARATDAATAATAKLNATMLANPYALVITAVAALAYGIYKLATYETDAEKAQRRLDEATADCRKTIASEEAQISYLFSRLKNAKEGTDEYKNAKEAIISQYGSYLQGLNNEIATLKDVEGAYKAVAAAARDAANARAMEAYLKTEADNLADKQGDIKDKIYQKLKKKYGNQKLASGRLKADDVYWQIISALQNGKGFNEAWLKEFDVTRTVTDRAHGEEYTVTTNEMRELLGNYRSAQKVFDDAMAEAERRFGKAPEEKKEDNTPPEKYQDGVTAARNRLKTARQNLDKLKKDATATTEAVKAAQAEVDSAEKALKDNYGVDVKAEGRASTKAQTAAEREQKQQNHIAVETAERNRKIQEYAVSVAKARRQAEFDIEQAAIDAMKDGIDKEIRQAELNYQKLIFANQQRREDMVEALRDKKQLEWENDHPKAKDEGLAFDRSTVTDKDLSKEQLDQLNEYERVARDIRERANKTALETMLADVMGYEQARLKLAQEYEEKRRQLYEINTDEKGNFMSYKTDENGNRIFRKGVKESNAAELNYQEQEALKAIDEQFAAREVDYQAWCDAIGNLTLKQLQDLLAKAKAELEALEQNGGDSKQLATARAKVNKLSETVKKQQATDQLAPKKRTIKEWQDLYSTLNECAGAFDDIGDAVGGTAGEILKAAGQISTSALQMINGIVTLANSSGTAMAGTAAAASTAIQTVEKASVILAVISAALQIATAIANLFNDDDKKQEEIERLQDRIDQLQWELDNADTLRLNSHYGSSLDRVNAAISETRKELIANAKVTGDWYQLMIACYGKLSNNAAALSKTTKALASEYEKMSYTADKALGDDRYNNYYEQLQNISEQQVLIREQIANEKSKKKSDSGQIAEWEQKIEELGQQAADVINDMLEDIIGGSATQISDDLSEAFFDAFANGEDAAEAWGDKVKEITADIVKRMLVQKLLEPEIGKIFDKYKAQWFKDGEFIGAEGVKNSMNSFMNDLLNLNGVMNEIWEAIPDDLRAFLTGDTDREGVSKGIAAASQDSVDELNARATTIQSHTFSISENTKLLVANTVSILASVLAIERHTEAISTRMEVVERDLHQVRNTIDDFSTQGVKLK